MVYDNRVPAANRFGVVKLGYIRVVIALAQNPILLHRFPLLRLRLDTLILVRIPAAVKLQGHVSKVLLYFWELGTLAERHRGQELHELFQYFEHHSPIRSLR
jgi:hypothetical protein